MRNGSDRLAFLTSSMNGGGAQRAMLKLAVGIARRGHRVDLVLGRAEGPYLAEVPGSLRVVDLGAPRLLAALPALTGYLRRECPLAMLSALDYVNIVALWARRAAGSTTRLVVSERNTLSAAMAHAARWRMRPMPWLIRRFYPWAEGVVAVSEGVADDLAAVTGLPRNRIEVIYNPVVTPDMAAMLREPVRHPWFRPGEPPVVLGVGRLTAQKDFATLVRAFASAHPRSEARLVILGEGPERASLEALVARCGVSGRVALPGFVANPYPYMASSGVFVLSSAWEGLPGVLIEALYCGVPVVATDCPSGPREVLRGGHGRLVGVGDVEAMATEIDKALAGAVPRPGPDSWKSFDQEVVVQRYLDTLIGT
jgi:glycosyltransferase involved in cell wall biosynthesis